MSIPTNLSIAAATYNGINIPINALQPPTQTKTAIPSLSAQTITPDSGKLLSSVSIDAITKELLATLDNDFVAANVKKNVDLFGLIGTLETGGGLPSGITEISTGIYTPTTSRLTGPGRTKDIAHGLSAPAKWVVMWDESFTIEETYSLKSAVAAYGALTENYRVGICIFKNENGTTGSGTYIEALSSQDIGYNGGIRPDYTSTTFGVVWSVNTYCIAGHNYRWIAGR